MKSSRQNLKLEETPFVPLVDLEEQKPSLNYLKNRSSDEIQQLQKKYNLLPEEMEEKLDKHGWYYLWNKFQYDVARLTNIAFPFFSGPNSKKGIQESVRLFVPQVKVSSEVAGPIGMVGASLTAGFYVAALDSQRQAIRTTLDYATRKPLGERVANFCTFASKHPCQALWDTAKYVFAETALTSTNLLGAATNMLGISAFLYDIHPALWWAGLVINLGIGPRYYDGFSNDEFWENMSFWFDKNRPWLISKITEEPALVLQVLVEGISTVLLRSISTGSTGETAHQEFGEWLPFAIVTALAFYAFLQQFYRNSYDHYLGSKVETIKLLKENEGLSQSEAEASFKELEAKALQNKSYGFAFREEPGIVGPLAFKSYVGMYYGYDYGIWGAIGGAMLMLAWGYQAEKTRITHNLGALEYSGESKEMSAQTCKEKAAWTLADTLTLSCGFSNMTMAIGQAVNVFEGAPGKFAAYLIMAVGATINNVRFAMPKTRASVSSALGTSARPSTVNATMFHHPLSVQEAPAEKKSRWCCFRR